MQMEKQDEVPDDFDLDISNEPTIRISASTCAA